jgi:hypothetical protein
MTWKDYLQAQMNEMTFVISIQTFIKDALKKYSESDIRKWAKKTVKNAYLDTLAKKMDINRLDIKSRLVAKKPLIFK